MDLCSRTVKKKRMQGVQQILYNHVDKPSFILCLGYLACTVHILYKFIFHTDLWKILKMRVLPDGSALFRPLKGKWFLSSMIAMQSHML